MALILINQPYPALGYGFIFSKLSVAMKPLCMMRPYIGGYFLCLKKRERSIGEYHLIREPKYKVFLWLCTRNTRGFRK